jgi:Ser/Thr protein kinase RdoA (MazF antagonist)
MKQWPVTMGVDRLRQIHRFQTHLAQTPRALTPALVAWSHRETVLEIDGAAWEIAEWKPGFPLEQVGEASDEQIVQCAEALARMHHRSESFESRTCVPDGLKQRLDAMIDAVRPGNDSRRRFLDTISTRDSYSASGILQDLFLRAICVIPDVFAPMRTLTEIPTACFWVLRDVWREHILFRDQRVSGIFDFGAARLDWPGLDLVRALGTMMFESDPRWQSALDRYLEVRPDPSMTLANLRAVHRASVALSGLQWLDWFAAGQFDWTNRSSQVWHRVKEIQRQLEDFERILLRE